MTQPARLCVWLICCCFRVEFQERNKSVKDDATSPIMRLVDLLLMLFFCFLRVSSEMLIFFVRGNVGKSEMLFSFEDMFFSLSSALLLLFLVEFWVFVSRVKTTLIPPSYELSK